MESDDALQGLYPFLHGERQDADQMQASLLTSIEQKAADSVAVKQDFFATNAQALIDASMALADVYRHQGRLLTMGNGGSSCDASHIAVEFLHPVTAGRPALPALNLCSDISMLTAVGNDVGFEHVFLRQLIAQGRAGDALIGISTSGNSENLMAAFRKAREMDIVTIGLAGMQGGEMKSSGLVQHCLVVESESIHRIQECQLATYHILWDLVHTLLADDRGGL